MVPAALHGRPVRPPRSCYRRLFRCGRAAYAEHRRLQGARTVTLAQWCYLCGGSDGEQRPCERCKRPICRDCAQRWHKWVWGHGSATLAECRPCFAAGVRRIVAEAQVLVGDAKPVPPFEAFGL
jgi:hypothetical protein